MPEQQHSTHDNPAELSSATSAGAAGYDAMKPPGMRHRGKESAALVADVIALAHTLVERVSARHALSHALVLGPRLLPDVNALRLFALGVEGYDRLVQIERVERTSAGGEFITRETALPTMTLGLGNTIDYQVLEEHQQIRASETLCVPLVSARGFLIGVLLVEESDARGQPSDPAMVTLLAEHLTILLEQWEHEQTAERSHFALRGLPSLAVPQAAIAAHSVALEEAEPEASATRTAEQDLLRETAGLLKVFAGSLACVALISEPSGALRSLVSKDGDIEPVPPEQATTLLAALCDKTSFVVTPRAQEAEYWELLAELRNWVTSRTGMDIGRITLLPVCVGREVVSVMVLLHGKPVADEIRWLPLATAICTATSAGIMSLRLSEDVDAQARARDAYISLAAHELRSPLTSIKGYAQLLARQARKTELPESMLRSLEAIDQQSMRMSEMVGELLDALRVRSGNLEIIPTESDLVPIVIKTVERRRSYYARGEIVLDIEPSSLSGVWDPQRVEQVIRDLLDNAARYSPEDGTITVRVTRDDSNALVSVRDQGTGIGDEERAHIFDYLYRAPSAERRNLSGLGLGLFVSRYLVNQMGGRLWLYATSTTEPRGSEFRFILPLG